MDTSSPPDVAPIAPLDESNRLLLQNVHPSAWVDPEPADCYDWLAIGGGTAGLVATAGAAGLGIGLRVALIERALMGGDCLNAGCVPSKCTIRASRVVGEAWRGEEFGVRVPPPEVDFGAVMARMRQLRATISQHDSVQRFRDLGVDVFLGEARFVAADAVMVNGKRLRFRKALVATGARALRPQIPGLEEVGYLTNETIFSLTELPPRLAVVGGGPIGCELAQAFQRLGSRVVLLQRGDRLLPREEPEASAVVERALRRDGVDVVLQSLLLRAIATAEGKQLVYRRDGEECCVEVDAILVAAGRTPNLEALHLEAAGIAYDRRGVRVNDYLQTTNPRVFAAGDICLDWKFTHTADASARLALTNALFAPLGLGKKRWRKEVVPWVTYTDPEVAHVGLTLEEAQQQGIAFEIVRVPFHTVDRAIVDGDLEGFLTLLLRQGSDRILGATLVAPHAGETIGALATAIVHGIGLGKLARIIHPYPTQAECIKKAADVYRRRLLTPATQRVLKWIWRLS